MKCAAIIVENRNIPGLDNIIQAHKRMLPADWDIVHVNDAPIKTIHDYNALLTSKRFWENMPWDRVLIFQHDSELLRPGIKDFLEWDYIGAPIPKIYDCMNGGLSVRNPKVMADICEKYPWAGEGSHGNEDIYFCNRLPWVNAKYPTQIGGFPMHLFACETEFQLGTLGAHAIDRYLSPEQCHQIRTQYI